MYYDEEKDSMSLCDLIYEKDLTYAIIRMNDKLYFANNGTDIPYNKLPIA